MGPIISSGPDPNQRAVKPAANPNGNNNKIAGMRSRQANHWAAIPKKRIVVKKIAGAEAKDALSGRG